MSSPPQSTNQNNSNPAQDSLERESGSISQSQQPPIVSSPLFFNSSNPGSDIGNFNSQSQSQSQSQRRNDISSPLHYTSSAQPTSDIGGFDSQRSARVQDVGRIMRRAQRSDVTDSVSSPQRSRRYFTQGRGNGPSNLNSSTSAQFSTDPAEPNDEPVRVIWGTNVSIQECSNIFRDFLLSFKYKYRRELEEQAIEPEDHELYYVNQLNNIIELGLTNLNLDAKNLLSYPSTRKLYYQLINYPQEIIPIMDHTIKDCLIQIINDANATTSPAQSKLDEIETNVYTIRPYNVNLVEKGIRELNPNDIDKLVSVKGLTLRSTSIIPDMKVAFFRCNACGHTVGVEIDRGVISEPTKCPREVCGQTNSMVLIHNRSSFSDKQVIKLQETPDLVPDGQTPHSINLCVYDELVDSCRAGDRVEVCGIFRSTPVRANPRQRALKNLYKTYLDIVHVKKIDKRRLGGDVTTLEHELAEKDQEVEQVRKITAEEEAKIKEISERDDLYEILARSLAPSIYEMDDVKKGILLQLFGGTNKTFTKGGRYRGDINILLCGDPSTSKSQILQYVHKIAPRGVYTSGKGSSAVGLTAYITRDIDTKQLVLESGALVLSDGGVCCIDEFDKMSDATRSVLHEVMEQQTISIAKAGIITTLNARTSILASANPINSRYDPNLPVTGNIDLPPPLLSRFDLVYLILDKVDESIDRQLARHLTDMYLEDAPETVNANSVLPVELLTLYIQYAKENFNPVMTEEGKNELVRSYVEMRKLGEDARSSEKRITATTRQLESMIRLSEAHAKMRLSERVELIDVKEAVRLIKSAIKDYATDPVTGRIDMDMIQTGTTAQQRRVQEDLVSEIMKIIEENNNLIRFNDLSVKLNERSSFRVENSVINEGLRRLQQEGKIMETGDSHRRTIRKIAIV
ncbi:minichromosome maintenance protein 4 (cell division control protein 54) [Candida albicans P57072]|uniref:DNA replication licensing factor MCM4 n=2 Tax=Candida albicans TaxID=5476 RepID=A0A1D8PFE6_CANAL|nr:MCM DNA helicase complex subunit [Candida albicans SC5314]KGQ97408.1 minichromosome maintenance protein 4 (cell division control protein 54) [Candida albicans P37005]KGR14472.1 minichromosome maintenance protein 4 (cell division control protein 54) [Candida albicans P57072]KGR16538.1 minichromosome maintenance protein 4 (cell division control protein 54) [Candida albicans P78048]KGT71698.1 minichromosome maintenance protein 4 (cell division control protein 54) [Candida albicans 12C]KGU16817|eukprot:XP_710791.1 MCM DNA helicase complex subunit [Candida albicans SC5314]